MLVHLVFLIGNIICELGFILFYMKNLFRKDKQKLEKVEGSNFSYKPIIEDKIEDKEIKEQSFVEKSKFKRTLDNVVKMPVK